MKISTLNDLFIEQLKDLYNSEDQIQKAYGQWKNAASSSDLQNMFDRHIQQSKNRRNDIEAICGGLDVSPAGEKCKGTEGLVREGHDFLEDAEGDAVKDAGLIANAQRVEHYGIAGYGCARTYALHLDDDNAAQKLQQALDNAEELDEQMTGLAERVLNVEAVKA